MRERIIQAYMEMAARQGLDGMTMDQVAGRAGVSKRTVYRYFASKEALLIAAIEELKQKMRHKVGQLAGLGLSPEEMVAEILSTLVREGNFLINPQGLEDLRVRYPQVWQDVDQFRQERLQELFRHLVGQVDTEVVPAIVSTIIVTSVREILNPEFLFANNLAFEETARQLSRLLLRMMTK